MKGKTMSIEGLMKKIIAKFYPDESFLSLILTSTSDDSFESSLAQWLNTIKDNYEPSSPFNPFYGITHPEPQKLKLTFTLNKENTDALFSFIKNSVLNEDKQLKGSIDDAFDLYTLDKLAFVDDKENNLSTVLPVNFYSFALSLKVLMQYHCSDIIAFSFGVFDDLFSFDETKEELFPSDLYCAYWLFLYFYETSAKSNRELACVLFNDPSVYEGFTFHISTIAEASELLEPSMRLNAIEMINFICRAASIKMSLYISSSISDETVKQLLRLCSAQLKISSVFVKAPSNTFLSFDISQLSTTSISLHVLSKGEVKLSSVRQSNKPTLRRFSIEGNGNNLRSIPSYMSLLQHFSYVTNAINLDISSLKSMSYLQSLTLKTLSYEQFSEFIELGSLIYLNEIDMEVIDFNENMLSAVDTLLNKPNFHTLRIVRILLKNSNLQLTKENGFYFINAVQEKLPKCSMFCLTNHIPFEIGRNKERRSDTYSLKHLKDCICYQDEFDTITCYTTYEAKENEVKMFAEKTKKNKALYDMSSYNALMLCIERRYARMKKKPILVLLGCFLCKPIGQVLFVGHFND